MTSINHHVLENQYGMSSMDEQAERYWHGIIIEQAYHQEHANKMASTCSYTLLNTQGEGSTITQHASRAI